MTEPAEYTRDHLTPDRNLHLEMLEQEATRMARVETYRAAINHRYGIGTHQALYWTDYVDDMIDDMSDSDADAIEAEGWPALLETLEEHRNNSQHP
jgi:hypothetical protein